MIGADIILYLLAFKIILLLLGFPIAFSAILMSTIYLILVDVPLSLVSQKISFSVANFTLLAIPLFMFAGKLANAAGISHRIFDFAEKLVGRIPGGLGHVNVLSSLIFSGMSGSMLADVAGLGEIEYKQMVRKGYEPDFSAGITMASAVIGPILPPSLPMVLFGMVSGVSVTGLFLGGVLPALLISLALMTYVTIIGIRKDYYIKIKLTWKALLVAFVWALPALFAPIIIVGGMTLGVFSPTEAATAAVLYTLVIAVFVYRELTFRNFLAVLYDTVIETSKLLFIIATALLLGWVVTDAQLPQTLTAFMARTISSPAIFILLVLLVLLFLGMIIENAILLLILAPMLAPIAANQFGFDPIHFGVLLVFVIMLGQFTPPIGLSLFVMRGITGFSLKRVTLAVMPFLVPLIISLLIMSFFPSIVLTIPRALGF